MSGPPFVPDRLPAGAAGPVMAPCPRCGAQVREDVEICPACGKWRHGTALLVAGLLAVFISLLAAFAVFTGTF